MVALLRHAPTAWNRAGRLQGRADIDLDDAAIDTLKRLTLPRPYAGWRAWCSPLRRARSTARLLLGRDAEIEPRLVEMDWGGYEGETIAALRTRLGTAFAENEALGLDFEPPGGESPRHVTLRLMPLLAEWAREQQDILAVTHKGVMRAVLARATGWDMRGKAPLKLAWPALQLFALDRHGIPSLVQGNIALTQT